jgi:hypothetical protein
MQPVDTPAPDLRSVWLARLVGRCLPVCPTAPISRPRERTHVGAPRGGRRGVG